MYTRDTTVVQEHNFGIFEGIISTLSHVHYLFSIFFPSHRCLYYKVLFWALLIPPFFLLSWSIFQALPHFIYMWVLLLLFLLCQWVWNDLSHQVSPGSKSSVETSFLQTEEAKSGTNTVSMLNEIFHCPSNIETLLLNCLISSLQVVLMCGARVNPIAHDFLLFIWSPVTSYSHTIWPECLLLYTVDVLV